jgi:hypothetical protein
MLLMVIFGGEAGVTTAGMLFIVLIIIAIVWSFAAGSRSLIGIGNTTALGYVHAVHEQIRAGGVFAMRGRVSWSSFNSPITG